MSSKKNFSDLTKVYIGSAWSRTHNGKTKDGKSYTKNYLSVSFKGGYENDAVEIILRDKKTGAEVPLYEATIQIEDGQKKSEKAPDKNVIAFLDLD